MKFQAIIAAASLVCFSILTLDVSAQSFLNARTASDSQAEALQSVDCVNGDAGGYSCSNIDVLSLLPIASMAGPDLSEVWGWVDDEDGHEYALVAHRSGVNFVDVTDPSNPIYVGQLPSPSGATGSSWRDVKTYQNYLYIVGDNAGAHGVQIFDLNQLRSVASPPVTFAQTAQYIDGVAGAHNIAINEATGFAYVVGDSGACGNGLYMLDLASPEAPVFAGCHNDGMTGRSGGGYVHDAQCVVYHGADETYAGREICFTANETDITIVDVEDKLNPSLLSTADYPNVGYVHQGWLTEDHRYFIQGDELDEVNGLIANTRTMIWDVSDLDDPMLIKEYLSTTTDIDHNLYVIGRLVYQANYTSGLRILNIQDITNPVEVGFFDTVSATGGSVWDGAWGAYPFLPSGNILISSGSQGLFVVRPSPIVLANETPAELELTSVDIFPNPSDQFATLRFVEETGSETSIEIFDVAGRSMNVLFDGFLPAGQTLLTIDTSAFSTGTYFARVTRPGTTSSRKFSVVR